MTCDLCAEGGHRYFTECLGCLARDLTRTPRSVIAPRLKLEKGRMAEGDYTRLLALMKHWHERDKHERAE